MDWKSSSREYSPSANMPQNVNERPCFSGTVRVSSLKLCRLFTRSAWGNMVGKETLRWTVMYLTDELLPHFFSMLALLKFAWDANWKYTLHVYNYCFLIGEVGQEAKKWTIKSKCVWDWLTKLQFHLHYMYTGTEMITARFTCTCTCYYILENSPQKKSVLIG